MGLRAAWSSSTCSVCSSELHIPSELRQLILSIPVFIILMIDNFPTLSSAVMNIDPVFQVIALSLPLTIWGSGPQPGLQVRRRRGRVPSSTATSVWRQTRVPSFVTTERILTRAPILPSSIILPTMTVFRRGIRMMTNPSIVHPSTILRIIRIVPRCITSQGNCIFTPLPFGNAEIGIGIPPNGDSILTFNKIVVARDKSDRRTRQVVKVIAHGLNPFIRTRGRSSKNLPLVLPLFITFPLTLSLSGTVGRRSPIGRALLGPFRTG